MSGVLALIGGDEFREGCADFDRELLAASGGTDVLVLPTAAAYEHPQRAVDSASAHFSSLGGTVTACMVLTRRDAFDDAHVEAVRSSRFTYLTGGSPMHLVSVLKETPLWEALVGAWDDGAVLAGSSAGAMVLCDPMVDPRGGAFTLGLGLVAQLALIPHHERWSEEKAKRTIDLAREALPIAGIDSQTALLRDPDGSWRAAGAGEVVVFRDGEKSDLSALPT